MRTVGKEAVRLEPGDECVGPMLFVDQGVVASTVVVDRGVQVNWAGGTLTVRPESYVFEVVEGRRLGEPGAVRRLRLGRGGTGD